MSGEIILYMYNNSQIIKEFGFSSEGRSHEPFHLIMLLFNLKFKFGKLKPTTCLWFLDVCFSPSGLENSPDCDNELIVSSYLERSSAGSICLMVIIILFYDVLCMWVLIGIAVSGSFLPAAASTRQGSLIPIPVCFFTANNIIVYLFIWVLYLGGWNSLMIVKV